VRARRRQVRFVSDGKILKIANQDLPA